MKEMILRFDELEKIGEIYVNPKNFKVKPLFLKTWKDLLSLDENIYGLYAKTIYNPRQRFLVKDNEDLKKAKKLIELYKEFKENPLRFCHEEYYRFHLENANFKDLPLGQGFMSSKIVLVGEAPGIKGCGFTGICFYRDKSGMLLRKTLFSLGINPDFLYITNVVKCTPPKNKLTKGFDERELELLKRELKTIDAKGVFAIGRTAEKALKKLKTDVIYLKHPAWYIRRGINDPNKEILEEYSKIVEAFK